jgi:tape measure domain-containing protein
VAQNRRDVELGIAVQTAGAEEIQKLAADVKKLADQGGEAAPEFQRLAAEIDRIANNIKAVSAFAEIRSEVEQLAKAQAEAARRAEPLAAQYRELGAATKSAAEAVRAAKDEEIRSREVLADKRLELKLLGLQTDDATKSTVEYKTKVRDLKISIEELRVAYREAQAETRAASRASQDASAAESALRDSYQKSQVALEASNAALDKRSKGLTDAESKLRAAGVQTDKLVQEEQRLRTELTQASAAAQKLQTDLQGLAEKQAQLAEQSRKAAAALDDAFGALGVRSPQAIKAEIDKVNSSLVTLATDSRVSGAEFDRAFRAAQVRLGELNAELNTVPDQTRKAGAGFDYLRSTVAQLAAVYGGIELGTRFIEAATQIETLRRSLTLVTGSTEAAAEQIRLLRESANLAGVSIGGISQSFVNFQAAMRLAGQTSETTGNIFKGVSAAAGQLGLSSDRVSLVLTALGQIANKGKVSLEELQGQLGESLPGALKISADSLGITTAELTKLVSTGDLLAEEFLPAFGRAVNETFANGASKAEGFAQAWGRLKNAITVAVQDASDSALWRGLTTLIDGAATNFSTLIGVVESLGKAFLTLKAIEITREFLGIGTAATAAAAAKARLAAASEADAIASTSQAAATSRATAAIEVNTVATAANTAAKSANAAAAASNLTLMGAIGTAAASTAAGVGALTTRLGSLVGALGGPYGAALTATIALSDQLGNGIASLAARLTGVKGELDRNEAALKKLAEAEAEAARAATAAVGSYTQVQVAYGKLAEAAEKATAVAKKLEEAKKVEGEASVALARLYGDEAATRLRAATAAQENVTASKKLASAVGEELAIQTRLRVTLIEAAGGRERLTAAQKEQIAKIDELIEKLGAEATLQRNRLEDLKNEAAQATITAKATQDNAAALDALRLQRDGAAKTLEYYLTLERAGLVVGTDMAKLRRDLAVAEGLYRDALADTSRNLGLRIQTLQADAAATKTTLDLKLADAKASEQVALANGDERGAIEAKVRQKELEIEATRVSAREKRAEAQATIEKLQRDREEIRGTDDLSEAKRQEIDLRIRAEQQKLREAGASDSVVKGLEAEIYAIRQKTIAVQAYQRVAANPDPYGRSDTQVDALKKQGGPVDFSYMFQIRDRVNRGDKFAASELPALQAALEAAKSNATLSYSNPGSTSLNGLRDMDAFVQQITRAVDQARSAPTAEQKANQSQVQPVGGTQTININLGGKSTSIKVASASDAAALTSLLRQLEEAAGRGG